MFTSFLNLIKGLFSAGMSLTLAIRDKDGCVIIWNVQCAPLVQHWLFPYKGVEADLIKTVK
jgi:hypothetical protein